MDEYKYYALVEKKTGKITNLIMSSVKPQDTKFVEVLELTPSTFCDLAYNDSGLTVA